MAELLSNSRHNFHCAGMVRIGVDFSHAGVLVATEDAGSFQIELPAGVGREAVPQLMRMPTALPITKQKPQRNVPSCFTQRRSPGQVAGRAI